MLNRKLCYDFLPGASLMLNRCAREEMGSERISNWIYVAASRRRSSVCLVYKLRDEPLFSRCQTRSDTLAASAQVPRVEYHPSATNDGADPNSFSLSLSLFFSRTRSFLLPKCFNPWNGRGFVSKTAGDQMFRRKVHQQQTSLQCRSLSNVIFSRCHPAGIDFRCPKNWLSALWNFFNLQNRGENPYIYISALARCHSHYCHRI